MKNWRKLALASSLLLVNSQLMADSSCRECVTRYVVWSTPLDPGSNEVPDNWLRDYNLVPRGSEPGNAIVTTPRRQEDVESNVKVLNKKARSKTISFWDRISKFRLSDLMPTIDIDFGFKTEGKETSGGTTKEYKTTIDVCIKVNGQRECKSAAEFHGNSIDAWKSINNQYTSRMAFYFAKNRMANDSEVEELLAVKNSLPLKTKYGESIQCPVIKGTDIVRVYDHFGGPNFRCPNGYRMIGGGSPLHGETGFEMTCLEKDRVGTCEFNDDHFISLYEYALGM